MGTAQKKADAVERQLAGYRRAVIVLGRHGFDEARIRRLTLAELDGYLSAIGHLNGTSRPVSPSGERRIVSQRRKT